VRRAAGCCCILFPGLSAPFSGGFSKGPSWRLALTALLFQQLGIFLNHHDLN